MNTALWIVQIVVAVAFIGTGALKIVKSRESLLDQPTMGWVADFSGAQVRMIGLVEIAGALGLILPGLLGIALWLTPIAAAGLSLNMLGAFGTHVRRGDSAAIRRPSIILGVLSALVAVGRYVVTPL